MSLAVQISEGVWLTALETCWKSFEEPNRDLLKSQVLRGDEDGIEYLRLPWVCRQSPKQVRQAVDAFRSLSFESKLFFLPMFMVSYIEDPDTADVGLESIAQFLSIACHQIMELPQGVEIASLITVYLLCRLSNEPIDDEIYAAREFTQVQRRG